MSIAIKDTFEVTWIALWYFSSNHRPFQCAALVVEADVVCEDVIMLAPRAVDGLLCQQGQLLGCGNLIGIFFGSVAAFIRLGNRAVPASSVIRINRVASIVSLVIDHLAVNEIAAHEIGIRPVINDPVAS